MLTVTDEAAQYVRGTLKKESSPGAAVRIVKTEEGYHLILDEAKEGDQVFEHEGENYLLLDTEVGEVLSDATMDVRESPEGTRLTLSGATLPSSSRTNARQVRVGGRSPETKPLHPPLGYRDG